MSDPKPTSGKMTAKDGHTYHKSTSANASVAPTNQATIDNATKQGSLTNDQLDFVTIVHYEWGMCGQLPTKDFLVSEYKYTANEVLTNYNNGLVVEALRERGVELKDKHLSPVGLNSEPKVIRPSPKLSAIQLVAANMLLDLSDTRSEKKKLQDINITTAKYQSWLRDPDFSGYLQARAEALIGDVGHEAMLSLVDGVRSGNINHIKYFHEITGRFVQQRDSTNGGSSHDLSLILIRIVEILNDEIDDPQLAVRISDRLKGLVLGGALASVASGGMDHITIPEIAKAREQTPQVQELMNRGVGYDQ